MSEHEGGIGSLNLADVDGEPALAAGKEYDPELEAQLSLALRENSATLTALKDRLVEQANEVVQLRGQVARFEAILPQYNEAFRQMDGRLNALAQQVMRNARFAALDLATKSRSPGEQAGSVVKNAEAYLKFIDPPAPAQDVEAGVLQEPSTVTTH